MDQGHIAGEGAEAGTEMLQGGARQGIGAGKGALPQRLVVGRRGRASAPGSAARMSARPGPETTRSTETRPIFLPQPRQQRVLERIARRKAEMAAFGLDHAMAVRIQQGQGDAEPGAGAEDADGARMRERPLRPADMGEIIGPSCATAWPTAPKSLTSVSRSTPSSFASVARRSRHGLLVNFSTSPRTRVATARDGRARRRAVGFREKGAPRLGKPGIVRDPEHMRRAERADAAVRDARHREARVSAANVADGDFLVLHFRPGSRLVSFEP